MRNEVYRSFINSTRAEDTTKFLVHSQYHEANRGILNTPYQYIIDQVSILQFLPEIIVVSLFLWSGKLCNITINEGKEVWS